MNSAENEVLEHALGELLGAQPTDLAQKVLRRLRTGSDGEDARPPAPRTARRLVSLTAAAAAALVAAGWLVDRQLRRSDPEALPYVATTDGELGVFRVGETEQRRGAGFRAGETLVNGPAREQSVVLSTGDRITMGRCAMLTLAEDEHGLVLEPRLGRATLAAADPSGLRVRTRVGTLVLHASAVAEVELIVDGYDLEHPQLFQQLAQDLHMNRTTPLLLTLATLLTGTATIESPTGARPWTTGEPLRDQEANASLERIHGKLLEEVGTWDLTVTLYDGDGRPGEPLPGVEVCRAGPGGKWLLTELSVDLGEREVALHTVIGYDPPKGRYTGSLVDSFGGEIGLLKGVPEPELESRTLQMYSAESTPGFDSRWRMHWESPTERHTEIEALQGEEWILVREIVHKRRK